MKTEVNKYSEYVDTEIEWLGTVPQHWEVTRLKYFLTEPLKYGANEAAELEDHDSPRYIRITDIKDDGTLKDETYKSLEFEVAKPYLLKDGDVLLARSGATVGKTFQYRSEWGVSAYAGYLIRARFVNQKIADWFYYFSKSKAYWDWLKSTFIQATIQNVSAEKYSNLFFSVPPQEEVDQILTFLNQQTTRIDQLIEKKKRILELLDEQRQATITRAVTKGIDPNAKMKDSGIEWLGEVPEHWDITKIKRLTSKIGSGKTPKGGSNIYVNDGVLFLRSQNIHFDGLRLEDAVFIPEEIDADMENTRVIEGDLLLNITGASLGRVCLYSITDTKANVNQHVCIIRISKHLQIDKRFVLFGFISKALQYQIFSSENGTSREGLNFEQVGSLLITLPPVEEQKEIADYLSEKVNKIDHLKSKIELALDHLEEYRSSLITQAVTGKIDVRYEVSEQGLSYAAEEGEAYTTN